MSFHDEIVTIRGVQVRIQYEYDDGFHCLPWIEEDGWGEIRTANRRYGGRPRKRPGEVFIHEEQGTFWIYDVQATQAKALREGWGITGDTTGLTKRQVAALAVQRDMEAARKWLSGDLFYISINVSLVDDPDTGHNIGGFTYGWNKADREYADEYAMSTAKSLADDVIAERRSARLALVKEERERRYWTCRDVETV